MAITPSENDIVTSKYSTSLFLVLTVAGLAGNYFSVPIFLNMYFLFGSIFAMLALQFFGSGRGVIAAAVIAGSTCFLWNHPYAIITMTAEVAVVGWLMRHRKMGMVVADTLYWLIIGMPLVYLFYHLVMHVPSSDTYIVMTKHSVNGIFNTLIAHLIFIVYTVRTKSSQTSYREIIYSLLGFFVLFPVLIMLALGSRTDFSETDKHIRAVLINASKRQNQFLDTWVKNRKRVIVNLAEMAASRSSQQMQIFLEQTNKSDVNFLRIGLLDREATVTAYFPLIDELGQHNIGKNFADRPYVPVLKQTLKPLLSEVVIGRIGVPKPTVMILAPVISHGEYGGYVAGILSLEQIQEHLEEDFTENTTFYTLVDKNGNVIMTNRADQKVMSPFMRGKGSLNRLDSSISQWVPPRDPNTPVMETWGKILYVAESSIGDLAEWRLIQEQPVAPFQKQLYASYAGKLTLLFVILLGALALAEFLSRKIVITLKKLNTITQELPVRLATDGNDIVWPESAIQEACNLIGNFREMSDSLSGQFAEIQQINASLEQRVEERTGELNSVNTQLAADITKRKLSEEALAKTYAETVAILQCAAEGIMGLDADGNHTFVNTAAAGMLGYKSEELLGKNSHNIWHYKHADGSPYPVGDCPLHATLHEGNPSVGEDSFFRKDGTYFIAEFSSMPLFTDSRITGAVFSFSDISDRKRAEEEKVKLENQLLQAQKMESVGRLAGGVAHDFNNMLGVILGYAELVLMKMEPSHPHYTALIEIQKAAGRSADLTRQLLAFARKQTVAPKVINLNDTVSGMLKMLQRLIGEDIHLTWQPAPDLWLVRIDPSQVDQMLANLCVNARDAISNVGRITVETGNSIIDASYATSHTYVEPGEYVRLVVSDDGCGMDKETVAHIFEPFYTTKELGKGTGLGLATVYGIVKQNNGFINVYSEPDQGTIFTIYLPRHAGESGEARVKGIAEKAPRGNETILLVEDEPVILEMTALMLEGQGYVVIKAGSTGEAIRLFKEQAGKIHLLMTDVIMPEMNGLDLAKELQLLSPQLKCLFMSGYTADVIAHHGVLEEGIHFIQKPFSLPDLALKVREVLAGK